MTRLYARGRVLSHQRGKRITHPKTSIIHVEGAQNQKDAQFYLGKVSLLLHLFGLILIIFI